MAKLSIECFFKDVNDDLITANDATFECEYVINDKYGIGIAMSTQRLDSEENHVTTTIYGDDLNALYKYLEYVLKLNEK